MFVIQGRMKNQSTIVGDKRNMARYIREKLVSMWSKGMHRKRKVKTAVKEISYALRENFKDINLSLHVCSRTPNCALNCRTSASSSKRLFISCSAFLSAFSLLL